MVRTGLRVVAGIQIILGMAYLFFPVQFLRQMGHSMPAPDLLYPLGMLAARFIGYGIGLWIASAAPVRNLLWLRVMAGIQMVDLGVGLFYTLRGIVPWSLSAFPMFNAVWIAAFLLLWRPAAAAR